jgi:hypothetical protein
VLFWWLIFLSVPLPFLLAFCLVGGSIVSRGGPSAGGRKNRTASGSTQ